MPFFEELQANIRGIYEKVLHEKGCRQTDITLNCSYATIMEEIKRMHNQCNIKGLKALDFANRIIQMLLSKKFFVYENDRMSTIIGWMYLKSKGMTKTQCPAWNINVNSTLADIAAETSTW
jgi:hypothetical protein